MARAMHSWRVWAPSVSRSELIPGNPMPLYEITPDKIRRVPATTFSVAGMREREDIQRLLREQIEIIAPDTLIIAEEFSEWEDSRRRIDLLGIDRHANLIVIELKRTEDGGHMELQALRYAAMVSTMTFDQAVDVFGRYLKSRERSDDPRATILDFLGWGEPDEDRFAQDVRIVLASAEFSREITATAMWLNDQGLDIRCVRMQPYLDGQRVFLNVQQVIPLPEASEYQIRVREKVQRERVARRDASGRDYMKYTVVSPDGESTDLPKRRAMFELTRALVANGVPIGSIKEVFEADTNLGPGDRILFSVPGEVGSEAFIDAASRMSEVDGRIFDRRRYFCADDELFQSDGRTYALTNQWGSPTFEYAVAALLREFPDKGVSCEPAGTGSD